MDALALLSYVGPCDFPAASVARGYVMLCYVEPHGPILPQLISELLGVRDAVFTALGNFAHNAFITK